MGRPIECPLSIGQRVTVSRSVPFWSDWPDEYRVTAIRWEYNKADGRQLNISIASDEEIQRHYGDTDGFSPADLIPITLKVSPHGRSGEADPSASRIFANASAARPREGRSTYKICWSQDLDFHSRLSRCWLDRSHRSGQSVPLQLVRHIDHSRRPRAPLIQCGRFEMSVPRFCESTPEGRVIHCGPAEGNDYVLCGAAMDGETGGEFMTDVSRGKINCLRCVAIIRFCKAIPARVLSSSGKTGE